MLLTFRPSVAPRFRAALFCALAGALVGGVARADEKSECLDAASSGQTLRDAHALVEARGKFQACARSSCPPLVQTDCAEWLAAVERTVPSVVLSAKDGAGRDLFDVTVSVDDRPFAQKLDGEAVAINPGVHTFRFEVVGGAVATTRVLVKEGEKAQEIAIVVAPAAPVAAGVGSSVSEPVPPPPPPAPPAAERPMTWPRATAIALGGAGIVGLAVGGGVALDAKSKDNSVAANETSPTRHSDSVNAVSEGNAATVVMVAGAALAVAGVVLWLAAPSPRVAIGTNGSALFVAGTF